MAASDYPERAAALDAACERTGRDPSTVTRSLCRFALVGEDEADLARRFRRFQEEGPPGVLDGVQLDTWRAGRLVGTVEQVGEQLRQWEANGVSTVIVTVGPVPFSLVSDDDLDLVAAACNLEGQCSDSELPN